MPEFIQKTHIRTHIYENKCVNTINNECGHVEVTLLFLKVVRVSLTILKITKPKIFSMKNRANMKLK